MDASTINYIELVFLLLVIGGVLAIVPASELRRSKKHNPSYRQLPRPAELPRPSLDAWLKNHSR